MEFGKVLYVSSVSRHRGDTGCAAYTKVSPKTVRYGVHQGVALKSANLDTYSMKNRNFGDFGGKNLSKFEKMKDKNLFISATN